MLRRRRPRPRAPGPSTLFLHVATVGARYQEIADELMGRVVASGLADVLDAAHVNVVGPGDLRCDVLEDRVSVVEHSSGELEDFEFSTLEMLHGFCRRRPGQRVLYLHSKGVSKEDPKDIEAVGAWVRVMSERLIDRHLECLDFLQLGYDTVGVDWANTYEKQHVPGHYSGNFWWASADYIRRLPPIAKIRRVSMRFGSVRHNAEFWIGLRKPRRVSLCQWIGTAHCEP